MSFTKCCNTSTLKFYIKTIRTLRTRIIHISYRSKCAIACKINLKMPSNMPKVYVKTASDEERVQMSLLYPIGTLLKQFNLSRLKSEEIRKTFERLSANISKVKIKEAKKRRNNSKEYSDDTPTVRIKILASNDTEISEETTNFDAFLDGHTLVIEDHSYQVCVNQPDIIKLTVPSSTIAGFPVYPAVELENAELGLSEFSWFRSLETCSREDKEATNRKKKFISWECFHSGFMVIPDNNLIGKQLKLVCTPKNACKTGEQVETQSLCTVAAGPGHCPYMSRHEFTKDLTSNDEIRVVSYNILADTYADSDFSRDLLFPYCPKFALDIDYRKQLFTSELIGYNADLICLQECDTKVFNDDLNPILQDEGYEGHMKRKGQVPEGTAIFFRRSKFKVLASYDFLLADELQNNQINKDLYKKVCQSEGLRQKVINRSTSFQVLLLENIGQQKSPPILLATTHLFSHPKAPHIRMIQTAVCLSCIKEIVEKHTTESVEPTVIFVGDFNTAPTEGNLPFIIDKKVSASHSEWMQGGEEQYAPGMDLQHYFNFISACGYPDFTVYNSGFKGCIDYIFINDNVFDVKQIIPLPTEEELSLHTAIPSLVCPSDHLALVCDLKWKK